MDGIQIVLETLKFFEMNKDSLAGMASAGTLLTTGAKASVSVIQKGAKMISYLITRKKKEPAKPASDKTKTVRSRKPAASAESEPKVTKKDVAIVIDITHRSLTQVAEYLDSEKIDADFIVITNDPTYGDKIKMVKPQNEKEWKAILKDFASHMTKIQKTVGNARVHIFMSTPLALAFGLGCVWGTVHPATIYHYEEGTYHPVLQVTRDWKQG
jgi:hypothetical protein